MKKLLLLAGLIVVLSAPSANAFGDRDNVRSHRRIKADEMAGIGVGAAALVGAAGYFLLRRRNAS